MVAVSSNNPFKRYARQLSTAMDERVNEINPNLHMEHIKMYEEEVQCHR